jgi:uncharacterized membrane protein
VETAAPNSEFDLIIKRNCSISPAALLVLLGAMILTSLGIAAAFAWLGAWLVLPFAGIEMVGLIAAFYLNGRHCGDYERIGLHRGRLVVEVHEAQTTRRHEFEAAWVRIAERFRGLDYRLMLRVKGTELEIGRHYDVERRLALAATLKQRLHSY